MTEPFSELLSRARSDALQMKGQAVRSAAADPYPQFWQYAASLATRWADALCDYPLDWSVLGALREEARMKKDRAGIGLFAFCNGIESTYVSLRAASLLRVDETK